MTWEIAPNSSPDLILPWQTDPHRPLSAVQVDAEAVAEKVLRISVSVTLVLVKGDRVEVLVDVGGSVAERFEIAARRAGRRVEVSNVRGTVEVSEVTRSGTPVRTARFMASRVIAVVEHPAGDPVPD